MIADDDDDKKCQQIIIFMKKISRNSKLFDDLEWKQLWNEGYFDDFIQHEKHEDLIHIKTG